VRRSETFTGAPSTGTAVLFGGCCTDFSIGDTWTWDGTTWTRQHPTTTPTPRSSASMAYGAATSTVMLFGGYRDIGAGALGDTWTWDGTTWTQQRPATHPHRREGASMAYDAATGTVVLFGGDGHQKGNMLLHDTWTWG
jgi:hypothetical protein